MNRLAMFGEAALLELSGPPCFLPTLSMPDASGALAVPHSPSIGTFPPCRPGDLALRGMLESPFMLVLAGACCDTTAEAPLLEPRGDCGLATPTMLLESGLGGDCGLTFCTPLPLTSALGEDCGLGGDCGLVDL